MSEMNQPPSVTSQFQYEAHLSFQEVEQRMKELIEYMKSDKYWLKYGGSFPYWEDGLELLSNYSRMFQSQCIPQEDTLIGDFNDRLSENAAKPDIQDRSTNRKVKAVMMSGHIIEVPLSRIRTLPGIAKHIKRTLKRQGKPCGKHINFLLDNQMLEYFDRVIVTDDTILTIVISN